MPSHPILVFGQIPRTLPCGCQLDRVEFSGLFGHTRPRASSEVEPSGHFQTWPQAMPWDRGRTGQIHPGQLFSVREQL